MDYHIESPERSRHASDNETDPMVGHLPSRASCSLHDASMSSTSGLSDLWSVEMDTSEMDNAINERLLNLTPEEEDEDEFNRIVAVVGRQLALIGDDINDIYAPHFREVTRIFGPRVLCRCTASAFKSFVRRRCQWIKESLTSLVPKVVHFLSEIVLRVRRTAELMQEDLCQQYSHCCLQWKAACNHVERTTHMPLAGLVMATVAMAAFAAITYTVESGV